MSLEATINVNSLPDQELEKLLEAVTEYENSLEADQPLNSDTLGTYCHFAVMTVIKLEKMFDIFIKIL